MTAAYRWCVLYVDTPDPATLVPVVADLLGPADHLDVFRVPGFTVDVRRNPDRTRGPHHLDWPSTVDIDATGDVPDEKIPGFHERLQVRPGLTGVAQIFAPRDVPRRNKFRYDLLYIRRQSFPLDLRLILLSFWITFRGAWERREGKF